MTQMAFGPSASESGEPAARELSVRDLALTLWRYKLMILTMVSAITVLSYLYIDSLTPLYQAEASLVLDSRRANVGIDPVVASVQPEASVIRSEVDVLRSRWLARRVVDELSLVNDAEFNTALQPPHFSMRQWLFDRVDDAQANLIALDILPGWMKPFIEKTVEEPSIETESGDAGRVSAVTRRVLSRLTVLNDGRSYTVDLKFQSEDPAKAAVIVDTFADLYLEGQIESKYVAAERGATWLETKIGQLRDRVRKSEDAVLTFRENNALLQGDKENLLDQRIEQFTDELVEAEHHRIVTESRLSGIREIAARPLTANSVLAMSQWPQLDRMLESIRRVDAELADHESTYGASHPIITRLTAERDRLEQQYRDQIDRIAAGLESEARLASAQETAFLAKLRDLEAQNAEVQRLRIELRQLVSEAAAARSLYDTFVANLDRTSVQLDLVQPDARVLSFSDPPPSPSYPQRKILLVLAVIAGLGLSLILIIVLEVLKQGFRSASEVENALGIPVISMVPLIGNRGVGARHPSSYALQRPYSAFSESIRLIRSAIGQAAGGSKRRVVLVTSAIPEEGKTTLALTIGRMASAAGEKALIIDCDLRAPTVSKDLDSWSGGGLAEVLMGRATIKDVVRRDNWSGLSFVAAGETTLEAIEHVNSGRMEEVVGQAARDYDMVILDSPPVMVVSDPLALARIAGLTLMVVRWNQTPRSLAKTALTKLHASAATMVGVVLSQVDMPRHASYGFGDFPHGYVKGYLSD
ncbi:MAG: GumC family protein [Geminicoccaceae bacterium]